MYNVTYIHTWSLKMHSEAKNVLCKWPHPEDQVLNLSRLDLLGVATYRCIQKELSLIRTKSYHSHLSKSYHSHPKPPQSSKEVKTLNETKLN